jgi:predicted TIM-barrel fold metal-dependent hydrolase
MDASELTLVSANCHIIETPDVFQGRMPAKWADRAPRVEPVQTGVGWIFEDQVVPLHRSCAVAGMTPGQWLETYVVDYPDIRDGCYKPESRIADLDLDNCSATVLYSSPAGIGFGGELFAHAKDPELGIAAMRAWNDWYLETWIASAPERFIPLQATWYRDAEVAAAEIYRNAERGFRGVMLRNPSDLGLPWLGDKIWDPFLRACQETGTVISHHTDAGHGYIPGTPYGLGSTLFQSGAMEAVASFVWAGLGTRFPGLKVTVAESGGGWLPHLIDRLEWCLDYSLLHRRGWPDPDRRPLELLRETFTFSTLEADRAYQLSQELDFHNWMIEIDYPHMESVWPNSHKRYTGLLKEADPEFIEAITWKNVAKLYDFPVPSPAVNHG